MTWLFSLAIIDVAGVDATAAATQLQLRPIEGGALFFTGLLVLAGLATPSVETKQVSRVLSRNNY